MSLISSSLPLVRRGLLAGGAAGLAAGTFSFLVARPVIDRAVALEPHEPHAEETFSRSTQHVGLLVATLATGLAVGVLFAVAYAIVYRHAPARALVPAGGGPAREQEPAAADPWRQSVLLAGAGFVGVWLLPFLRYPANPPGVGDPATLALRTRLWFVAITIGVLAVIVAWQLHLYLARRGVSPPWRQLAVTATLTVATGALFLLPANPDPVAVPATLIWDFRLASLASAAVLWGVLGATFGLLGHRAETKS